MSTLLTTIELASRPPSTRAAIPPVPANAHRSSTASTDRPQNDTIRATDNEPEASSEDSSPGTTASVIMILQLCLVTILCSVTTGLITIGIPAIAADLKLMQSLVYWPVLVYTLTSATTLLPLGALADVLGSRSINLSGVFLLSIFTLSCGLAKTGSQLIAFRALGGVALSFFLPTSVSLISGLKQGRVRNVGFAMVGMGQVLGYAIGLVLGGVLVNTVGWRVGYWICGGVLFALFVLGLWALPANQRRSGEGWRDVWERVKAEIDWVGVGMASTALGLMAYVLAEVSSASSSIREARNVALLTVGVVLLPSCGLWFRFQERRGKPALMPNSLWKQLPFTTVCIMIMFAYAEMQTMELLSSLFFQQVQSLPAIQASLRILPSLVIGALLNFTTGLLVHRIPALWLVLSTSLISAASPLLMALIRPEWPYWYDAFPAQVLFPLCVDVLFTVALLVISEVFPQKDQALAGAVFNTVGQFGQSLGLAIIGVISNSVTQDAGSVGHTQALLKGYRAGFWTAFAWMVVTCAVGAFGLRKVGKVGLKRD